MGIDNSDRTTFSSLLKWLLSDWTALLKFLGFLVGVVLILCGGVYLFGYALRPAIPSANITITDKGAYIMELKGQRTIQWLFSASSLWSSSGIKINAGDRVKFRVSGGANAAIHHLVQSAITDSPPYYHWSGPDGVNEKQEKYFRAADYHRLPKRIAPGENPGKLLLQIVPEGQVLRNRPDPENLYVIGSGGNEPIRVRNSGILHFALNEIPLDSSMHDYYVITKDIDSTYFKTHKRAKQDSAWRNIVTDKYWHLWFDDNVGFFLIVAEIYSN